MFDTESFDRMLHKRKEKGEQVSIGKRLLFVAKRTILLDDDSTRPKTWSRARYINQMYQQQPIFMLLVFLNRNISRLRYTADASSMIL